MTDRSSTVRKAATHHDPLEFKLGSRQVIASFDNGVEGMEVGEKKTIAIEPEKACGNHNPEMAQVVRRTQFPEDANIQVDTQFQASTDGGPVVVTVVAMDGESPPSTPIMRWPASASTSRSNLSKLSDPVASQLSRSASI